MVRLLIDADVITYMSLFSVRGKGFFAGLRSTDNFLTNIIEYFNTNDYKLFVSGDTNFRKDIYCGYKSHRKSEDKPEYLYETKNFIKKYWEAEESVNCEADDLIAQNISDDCVIVSNDHDFKQLGVPMFNPRGWRMTHYGDPNYWFWLQMLTGCKTDNVKGLTNPNKLHWEKPPNFSEDTANEVLRDKSPQEMREVVQSLYQQIHGDQWFEKFDIAGRLLFLRRKNAKEYFELY